MSENSGYFVVKKKALPEVLLKVVETQALLRTGKAATIQEAVALTMQGQNDAIIAGFEASIGVQREILEAVLGIQLGDSVIGQAVTRYQQKMAVMQGG